MDRSIEVIQSLIKRGNFKEATVLCERICAKPGADARVWYILGAIHGENNRLAQAESCTRRALAIDPALGSAHHNLAIVLRRQGKAEEAEKSLHLAIKVCPTDAILHHELGNIFRLTGKINKAVDSHRRAIKLAPRFRDAHFNLGQTFLDMNDLHSALACMRAAYSCDQKFVKAKAMEAVILEMMGDIEGAWHCLEPLLERGVNDPTFVDAFAAVSEHINKEQQAIDLLIGAIRDNKIPDNELFGFYFRLGALHERLQQYDEAFRSYTQANRLSQAPNNSEDFIQSMREVRQIFTRNVVTPKGIPESSGEGLVFIVGMPRSGTSLVEQILSAHPQLVAAGEIGSLSSLARDVIKDLSAQELHTRGLDEKTIERYARHHLDMIRANYGSARRITDKTPHNFRYLGLIYLLFPGAHIIHCTRNALDTCASCYSKIFTGKELAYSNELVSLGTVYREYTSLMEYWRKDLSIPFLDVSYEAVIDDSGLWARRIVEYCGLEWDERCLEFHKQKRHVHTASRNQVRQPIYRSSINRWKHFSKHLGPLIQALGDEVN